MKRVPYINPECAQTLFLASVMNYVRAVARNLVQTHPQVLDGHKTTEDIIQDLSVRAWKAISAYQGRNLPRQEMLAILRVSLKNAATDLKRIAGRQKNSASHVIVSIRDEGEEETPDTVGPDELVQEEYTCPGFDLELLLKDAIADGVISRRDGEKIRAFLNKEDMDMRRIMSVVEKLRGYVKARGLENANIKEVVYHG